jgi:hypothetical protein
MLASGFHAMVFERYGGARNLEGSTNEAVRNGELFYCVEVKDMTGCSYLFKKSYYVL